MKNNILETKKAPFLNKRVPPEALFFEDGVTIEEMIKGYETVNVSGRELMGYVVNTQSVNNDGETFLSAYRPKREIVVKYKISAKNDIEFRQKFEYLNFVLAKKEFNFYFKDDPFYEWTGTVSSVEEFPVARNEGFSSFTITCSNPYKRRIQPTVKTKINELQITENCYFPTIPESIEITIKNSTSVLDISNKDLTIRLIKKLSPGDVVTIKPKSLESPVKVNNITDFGSLDITSDLENFLVQKGDTIVTNNKNSKITLKLRSNLL